MTEVASRPTLGDIGAIELFEKVLTSSDVNAQGRVVIPKAQAVQHLPPLDRDAVEVYCQDTCGEHHVLKFHSWINNQSRMYLLEGLQDIQALYALRVGDSLVFGRMPDGSLVACGRERIGPPLPVRPAASASPFVPLDRAKRKRRAPQKFFDPAEQDFQEYQQHQQQQQQYTWKQQDPLVPFFEPLLDGVFRAIPTGAPESAGTIAEEHGSWTATIDLSGELYRAFFDSQEAAQEALEAAAGQAVPVS